LELVSFANLNMISSLVKDRYVRRLTEVLPIILLVLLLSSVGEVPIVLIPRSILTWSRGAVEPDAIAPYGGVV